MCLHALLAMHDFRKNDKKRRYRDIHLISLVSLGTSLTWLYSGGVNIDFIILSSLNSSLPLLCSAVNQRHFAWPGEHHQPRFALLEQICTLLACWSRYVLYQPRFARLFIASLRSAESYRLSHIRSILTDNLSWLQVMGLGLRFLWYRLGL